MYLGLKKKKRYKSPAWIERRGFGPPWKIQNFLNSHSEVAKKKKALDPLPLPRKFSGYADACILNENDYECIFTVLLRYIDLRIRLLFLTLTINLYI